MVMVGTTLESCGDDEDGDNPGKGKAPNGVEAVDLGLTSGTLWANMNVGASSPEELGDYFAWGETKSKSDYSLSTYKWYNESSNKQTKYCTDASYGIVDNKTELDVKDDAAYVNWGSRWRIPSKAQFEELMRECVWTTTYINGVEGSLVKSKKNNNSIFIPGNHFCVDIRLGYPSSNGYYWSRTLDSYPDYAWCIITRSSPQMFNYHPREYGLGIRPVAVK